MRRNASRPILPRPMCSCRSTREPNGVFESFTCSTATRAEPHGAIERGDRLRQPRFGVNLVAGLEGVRRVEANAQRQLRRGVDDGLQLLEARADRRAHARRVFQQQRASGSRADRRTRSHRRIAARGLPHGLAPRRECACCRSLAAPAFPQQIPDAPPENPRPAPRREPSRRETPESTATRITGSERRQIDQVIRVDDQRAQPQFRALGAKLGGVDLRDARARRAATCAGWRRKSAARCSPASRRSRASRQSRRQWKCECRCERCRRARPEPAARARVRGGIRRCYRNRG